MPSEYYLEIPKERFNPNNPSHRKILSNVTHHFTKQLNTLRLFDFTLTSPIGFALLSCVFGPFPFMGVLILSLPLTNGLKRFRPDYYKPQQTTLDHLISVWQWCKNNRSDLVNYHAFRQMETYIQTYTTFSRDVKQEEKPSLFSLFTQTILGNRAQSPHIAALSKTTTPLHPQAFSFNEMVDTATRYCYGKW